MYSTLRGIKKGFQEELAEVYSEREIDQLFYRVIEYVTGKAKTDVILSFNEALEDVSLQETVDILGRLKAKEPMQYIDQQAYFIDDVFYVDSSVLIPRPETAELVQLILDENEDQTLSVLDIGTGSGIIPISLLKNRPSWEVLACDVSNEALVVARRNGREILKRGEVSFYKEDILAPSTYFPNGLDIIVSNPPYVLVSDQKQMTEQVLNHEPHLALFVDDNDALLFYREIIAYAESNLKPGGKLYFEVHEALAQDVLNLMTSEAYSGAIHLDLQGRSRMVAGIKPI